MAVSATRPTMRDVAHLAGVSLKTVSRVINDEAGVATDTAARVTDAIAALGFQRNDLARSLRHGRSSATVGLIIEDVANPFYSAVAQAVETAARERGLMLIIASCEEDPEREREMVTALLRRRVDALLVVPAGREHRWLQDAAAGTPVVFVDRPPQDIDADTVLLDDVGGARQAVEHLIAHGHRRIAYVSDAGALWTQSERLAGYKQAHEAAGIPIDEALVRLGTHRADEAEAVVHGPPRAARRTSAPPPSSPPTTATRSARCARSATAAGRPRSSASTTSSSPTCSERASSASSTPRSAGRPPRWRSRGSTATTGRHSGSSCRRSSWPGARGSGPR